METVAFIRWGFMLNDVTNMPKRFGASKITPNISTTQMESNRMANRVYVNAFCFYLDSYNWLQTNTFCLFKRIHTFFSKSLMKMRTTNMYGFNVSTTYNKLLMLFTKADK